MSDARPSTAKERAAHPRQSSSATVGGIGGIAPALRGGAMAIGGIAPALRGGATSMQRALVVAFVLFAVEQAFFPASYAARFVSSGGQYVRFVALCAALAALAAVPLALVVQTLRALEGRLRASARLSDAALGIWLQALALLAIGGVMSLCQDDAFLRPPPWSSAVVFALPAVAFLLCAQAAKGRVDGARYNATAIFVLLLIAWYFARYEILDRFLTGRYGLQGEALLRSSVDLGVPAGMAVAGSLAQVPLAVAFRGRRVALMVGAGAAIVGLHWVNASQFVDLHLPVHTALIMAAALLAWKAGAALPRLAHARAHPAILAVPLLAAAVALAFGPRSHATYLAAQHTAFARFGLELVHDGGAQIGERLTAAAGIVQRAGRTLRRRPLPAEGPPLPSTFTRPANDGAGEVAANGAVLFFLDMKRARDIGPDAGGATRTPRIDACFTGGFDFRNAFSTSTRTLTVLGTIYTATYAGSRGQTRPDLALTPHWFSYQNGHHNLVDAARGAGVATAALTNRYYLRYLTGSADRPLFGTFDRLIAPADEARGVNESLLAELAAHPELVPGSGRFLLVVHIMSHPLEELPEVDAVVGEVCAAVRRAGRMHDTAFMLTSDHGVQFGEHGRDTYGRTLFQEELHVPLLWRVPGRQGRAVQDPVSAVDHLPTLFDVLGMDVPFAIEGRSYARAFRGEALDRDRPIFFEVRRYEVPAVGVARRGMKLIRWPRTGTTALFSLADDPGELHSLTDDPAHARHLDELDRLLTRFERERH